MKEFNKAVKMLKHNKIDVILLDKRKCGDNWKEMIPDAVFPNWFTTYENGILAVF